MEGIILEKPFPNSASIASKWLVAICNHTRYCVAEILM